MIFEKDIKYPDRFAHVMSAHIMRANDLTFACVMTLRQTCGCSLKNEFTVVTRTLNTWMVKGVNQDIQ